jgi:hypothetical protein
MFLTARWAIGVAVIAMVWLSLHNIEIATLLLSLVEFLSFLPYILTRLCIIAIKVTLAFLVGLFTGSPMQAVVDLGQGLIVDLVALFRLVGAGFVAEFFKILWRGSCVLPEAFLNAVLLLVGNVTPGAWNPCCVSICTRTQ